MSQTATEPSAAMRQLAAVLWEQFRAMTEVGFTEQQTLTLLGHSLGSAIAQYPGDKPGGAR